MSSVTVASTLTTTADVTSTRTGTVVASTVALAPIPAFPLVVGDPGDRDWLTGGRWHLVEKF